jgi:hypothetical protein
MAAPCFLDLRHSWFGEIEERSFDCARRHSPHKAPRMKKQKPAHSAQDDDYLPRLGRSMLRCARCKATRWTSEDQL